MQIELINDDHSCPNCYYEWFDDKAYPCGRCIHNKPSEDMFRPKLRAEQTEPNCSEKPNNCDTCKWGEWYRKGYDITMMSDECGGCCSWNNKWTPKNEPQTDCAWK